MPLPKVEPVVFVALAAGLLAGYLKNRDALFEGEAEAEESAGGGGASLFEKVAYAVEGLVLKLDRSFNFPAVSNMRKLEPHIDTVRYEKNVVAFLHAIRHKEHYPSVAHTEAAYRALCGGGSFSDFSDHPTPERPRSVGVCWRGAAGAYQIVSGTWNWLAKDLRLRGLVDFSPVCQERAAVYLVAYRGALNDVRSGNLRAALDKCRKEWTSLPGAAENKGYTYEQAAAVYKSYGGQITTFGT